MANYKKSFNFRNGVQVDDDNFIINANGLVGIGTSIPTELLDVYNGTVKVTGLVTTTSLYAGTSTIGNLKVNQGINASGVITASSFSGSASGLTNIYAIAVDGWYISAGTISTSFNVGIGVTNPEYQFQVGKNPFQPNSNGLIIDIDGNLYSNGISTIKSLNVGDLIVTGISTIGTLGVTGLTTTRNLIVTGVSTIGTLGVTGLTTTRNLIVTGVSTIQNLIVNGIGTFTNLTVNNTITGTANTALGLSGTPNITVGVITASRIEISPNKLVIDSNGNANYSGIVTASNFVGSVIGIASTANSLTKNINIEVGIATISNRLYADSIGIGTNSPNSNLHLRQNNSATIQITSDTLDSSLVIGRTVNTQDKTGVLRFGNTSSLFQYSDSRSLDLLNYDSGNFNFYLQASNSGINTGSFYWHHRPNFKNLMSLTYNGNLGIGITNPTNTLHIVGTSTVTDNFYVGGNVSVVGSLDVKTTLTANILTASELNAALNGNVNGNVYSNTGISTFKDINCTGISSLSNINTYGVGIGTTSIGLNYLQAGSLGIRGFFVTNTGQVGVNTDKINDSDLYLVSIDACNGVGLFKGIGIGTTSPQCFADFSAAGYSAGGFGSRLQFMLPPKITTTVRNNLLEPLVEGAFIYNTTNKRLEIYNGDGWSGIATVP